MTTQDAAKLAKTLGDRLFIARRLIHKSQVEVADEAGVTQSTYSSYENGKSLPNILTLMALSDALDANVSWLLGLPEGDGKGPIQ